MARKKPTLTFFLLLTLTAAFAGASEVDTSDGVSEREAVSVAKEYMRDNGYDNDYMVFWPSVTDGTRYGNSWHVSFPPAVPTFLTGRFSFGVDVDKKTGAVISSDATQ